MTCEKFSYNGLQERDWIVRINRLQIINGGQTCKIIHQTLKEHPEIDFSQIYILVRLYEVGDGEDVIQDITYATNSQSPVDFRDLKSNDDRQILLEEGAGNLGYIYKRKRDNLSNTNVIPSTVAAESVLAVWREKPHLAKYKRNEFFDKYYADIFDDLNAAQMIMAVLIFRFCDSMRKRTGGGIRELAHRPYSQYYLAYLIGRRVLSDMEIGLDELTHLNFDKVRQYFEDNREALYAWAERVLGETLERYFNGDALEDVDGRTMAAVFRRFDLIERYLKQI